MTTTSQQTGEKGSWSLIAKPWTEFCLEETWPIRHLRLGIPLSEQAAGLVKTPPAEDFCDKPLVFSGQSITLPVAQALARHTHELYLAVSLIIATALSDHAGYSLTLDCDDGFTHAALQALSGNEKKRVRKAKRRYRVCVVDHLTDGPPNISLWKKRPCTIPMPPPCPLNLCATSTQPWQG